MAKATLEYDLNDLDDRMAHFRAVKSTDMASALHEISFNLRKRMEHMLEANDLKGIEMSNYEVIDTMMYKIHTIIAEDCGLNVDELIQ